jgi:hypothetical protein
MGGDDSQKLLPWRGILLLSRAQTSGSQQNLYSYKRRSARRGARWLLRLRRFLNFSWERHVIPDDRTHGFEQMNRQRALAGVITVTCFALSLFLFWWFWTLSAFVGAWHGLEHFRRAYDQAQLTRLAVVAVWLGCQVLGGIAAAVALDLEDGTVRGCARRTPFFTLAFFSVTTAGAFAAVFLLMSFPPR